MSGADHRDDRDCEKQERHRDERPRAPAIGAFGGVADRRTDRARTLSIEPGEVERCRGEAADQTTLDTDKIDELAIPDTGTFSLPAGSLKAKADGVEQERIRIERRATVIPTGAIVGSQMRVSVRNEVEILVQATGL